MDILSDVRMLPTVIAQALELADAKREPSLERLIEAIGGRPLLLVLDHIEHLLDSAPSISAMLGQCPQLKVLLTSRSLAAVQRRFMHRFDLGLNRLRGAVMPGATLPLPCEPMLGI